MTNIELIARETAQARVENVDQGWRFTLKEGEPGQYRLAQLDNYSKRARRNFPHRPPFELHLRARASKNDLPGSWGFGLWNDPFGFSLGFGGTARRLPALPNAVWFFFASSENHLSLHDNQPGDGPMAAVFRSPHIPALALAPALLGLPLLAWPPSARWLRRRAAGLIGQQAATLQIDVTQWHEYSMNWKSNRVDFKIDGNNVLSSKLTPRPPLALVMWLDNQYAAWRPDGRMSYGTLSTPADCWVEITDLHLN